MFIFLDPLELSPKLFADGESEICGLQIQRDRFQADLVGNRVWILLEQACFNWNSYWDKNPHFTHSWLILDIHGYTKLSIFLH